MIAKLQEAGLGHTAEWLDSEDEIVQRVPQLGGSDIQVQWFSFLCIGSSYTLVFKGLERHILRTEWVSCSSESNRLCRTGACTTWRQIHLWRVSFETPEI